MKPNMYADASPSLHVQQRDNLPGVNERIKSAYSNCIIYNKAYIYWNIYCILCRSDSFPRIIDPRFKKKSYSASYCRVHLSLLLIILLIILFMTASLHSHPCNKLNSVFLYVCTVVMTGLIQSLECGAGLRIKLI